MPLFWLALAVAIVAVVASSIYVTRRGSRPSGAPSGSADRSRRSSSGSSRRAAEIEQHLARAAESGSKLEAELERLQRSRAQLNVLTSAIDDVRASIGRVTAVYPRK